MILQNPGLPPLVIRTPLDGPPASLPSEVLADPDYATITLPPGTVVPLDASAKSILLMIDEAHANDEIYVVGHHDMVYGVTVQINHGPAATASQPAKP